MQLELCCMSNAMVRSVTLAVFIAFCVASVPSRAADDVATAYQNIQASLVKIWAFDSLGNPIQSGTGFIVSSDAASSYVLTAAHVVLDATKISVDVNRHVSDVPAKIIARRDNPDVALLRIERGGLTPVVFASAGHEIKIGAQLAVAGYFKSDEQIGLTGQAPRLRYPATLSSLADDGRFLELGLNIEEGLSGAPVFELSQGAVVGMVLTRAIDAQAAYAISAQPVLLSFLRSQQINVALESAKPSASQAPSSREPAAEARIAAQPIVAGVLTMRPGLRVDFSIYDGISSSGVFLGNYEFFNQVTTVTGFGGYTFDYWFTGINGTSGHQTVFAGDKVNGTTIHEFWGAGDLSARGFVSYLSVSDKTFSDLKAGRATPFQFDGPDSPGSIKEVDTEDLSTLVAQRDTTIRTIKARGTNGAMFWIVDDPAFPMLIRGQTAKWKWMATSIE
jgi:S1-C subfamily serine protease